MEKKCPCANPPKGYITCNVTQLGICGVIKGELIVGCFDPPDDGSGPGGAAMNVRETVVANWVLSKIMGEQRVPQQPITYDDQKILDSGHYQVGNTDVKFSVPGESENNAAPQPALMYR